MLILKKIAYLNIDIFKIKRSGRHNKIIMHAPGFSCHGIKRKPINLVVLPYFGSSKIIVWSMISCYIRFLRLLTTPAHWHRGRYTIYNVTNMCCNQLRWEGDISLKAGNQWCQWFSFSTLSTLDMYGRRFYQRIGVSRQLEISIVSFGIPGNIRKWRLFHLFCHLYRYAFSGVLRAVHAVVPSQL